MGTDFFGAHFPFPKQKLISVRCLIENYSVSTSQPLLFITKLGCAISMGGKQARHSQGCVHMASSGCSCAGWWGYRAWPFPAVNHSSLTIATADLEQDSAKPTHFDWCWFKEHWGMVSSLDSTALAGRGHARSTQVSQPMGFLLLEDAQSKVMCLPLIRIYCHAGLQGLQISQIPWRPEAGLRHLWQMPPPWHLLPFLLYLQ